MSTSIVRQALQLFDDDFRAGETGSTKKKKKPADPMKIIGTSRVGVKKKLQKLKQAKSNQKALQGKQMKCVVDEYRRRVPKDHTMTNLYKLHTLSEACQTESQYTQTILEQHRGRLSKNRPDEKKEEESPIFTDHDFEEFAKEYFS